MANAIDASICPACRETRAAGDLEPGDLIPDSVAGMIRRQHPGWSPADVVCSTCVNQAKAAHLQAVLESEMPALSPLARQVIDSIREHELVSAKTGDEQAQARTRGEQLADRIARTIGSWRFSSAVLVGLAVWVGVNVLFRPFDPYPVIILAMIGAALASLAALEGPIIMMNQRRQAARDRLRADDDYRVNLKAELEIRYLGEKIDHVLAYQQRLWQAQQAHGELLQQLVRQMSKDA